MFSIMYVLKALGDFTFGASPEGCEIELHTLIFLCVAEWKVAPHAIALVAKTSSGPVPQSFWISCAKKMPITPESKYPGKIHVSHERYFTLPANVRISMSSTFKP
jgi:hypothetical protein